jgi:hypothetical protein
MAGGSVLLVEAVRQITDIEETQTQLGLTLVGFATAFELVCLSTPLLAAACRTLRSPASSAPAATT